jgi:hypothetical protein
MGLDTRKRLEDLPRSRLEQRLGMLGRSGVHPVSSVYRTGAALCRIGSSCSERRRSELVETRRLELLTLSLQRRCSAN